MPEPLVPLPLTFAPTREALRALACYAISPARKARTGRIGLRATGDGFGTPPFDDGSRIVVRGDQLVVEPGDATSITTVRAAAEVLGIEVEPDPGVGHDLPPFAPDEPLDVDAAASFALGAWYRFGDEMLLDLAATTTLSTTESQLWPEHFDLAATIELDADTAVNVGFSPGDGFHADPYVYVGPHRLDGLDDPFWNAPFGAYLGWAELQATDDPRRRAVDFIRHGRTLLTPAATS